MQVISTPPKPAARYDSRQRVRFSSSTDEPCHHQRVQGRAVCVMTGHFSSATVATAGGRAAESGAAASACSKAANTARLMIAAVRTHYLRRHTRGNKANAASTHVTGSGTVALDNDEPEPCVAPKLARHVL